MTKKQRGVWGTKEARRETIMRMQAVKICPVTNGLPTTMTLEGFQAACERCREQDKRQLWHGRAYKYTWCDTCQGEQRPGELRILPLSQIKRQRAAQGKSRGMRQHPPAR